MKALCFEKTGSLDYLQVCKREDPKPQKGELLIRVKAAAINPSDVKNVLGKIKQTTLPRIPGRDFAGVVLEGPANLIGKEVFGTGGDLGSLRNGSHAELLTVPSEAVVLKPSSFSYEQAAAFPLAYLTACYAVVMTAQIRAGETILILGVTGAVGSAAAYVSFSKGARVIGTVRSREQQNAIPGLPVHDYIVLGEEPLPEAVMSRTSNRGADVVLDVVGGPMFEPCAQSLANRGRQVALASTDGSRVSFDLVDFYHREGRLLGVDTLKLSFLECAEILEALLPGIEQGSYPPPPLETLPLDEAPAAYRRIDSGAAKKKLVIVNET